MMIAIMAMVRVKRKMLRQQNDHYMMTMKMGMLMEIAMTMMTNMLMLMVIRIR